MIDSVNLRQEISALRQVGKVASSFILASGEAILEAVGLANEYWQGA